MAAQFLFILFMGRAYGFTTLRITVFHFCVTKEGLASMGDILLRALPSEVSEAQDLVTEAFLSGDTELSNLINDDMSDSLACY